MLTWLDWTTPETYIHAILGGVVVILWLRALALEHDLSSLLYRLEVERYERKADRVYLEDSIDDIAAGARGYHPARVRVYRKDTP